MDVPGGRRRRRPADVTAIEINGEWQWPYAAIDLDSWIVPAVEGFSRHGTDPAVAVLHRLIEKDGSNPEFLVSAYGYRPPSHDLDPAVGPTIGPETTSNNGLTCSRYTTTASSPRRWAVGWLFESEYSCSNTVITHDDQTTW